MSTLVFAFSGFEQPNYVLGEIRRPRKIFPRATTFGVITACLLYMAVNICYVSQDHSSQEQKPAEPRADSYHEDGRRTFYS